MTDSILLKYNKGNPKYYPNEFKIGNEPASHATGNEKYKILNIDRSTFSNNLSPENLKKMFTESMKNYKPPKVVLTVCIIDLRSAFAVNKIRLDIDKLNNDGLECFELSKYNRQSFKYKKGVTTYEYLNIPYNNFEISISFINKVIVPNFEEIWLIHDNDKQVRLLKHKYFANNNSVINKWDMHSYTYSPEDTFNPYICNSFLYAIKTVL